MIDILDQFLAKSSFFSQKRQYLGNLFIYFPLLLFYLQGLDLFL